MKNANDDLRSLQTSKANPTRRAPLRRLRGRRIAFPKGDHRRPPAFFVCDSLIGLLASSISATSWELLGRSWKRDVGTAIPRSEGRGEGKFMRRSWGALGPLGRDLGASRGDLGEVLSLLSASLGLLGRSWGRLGTSWEPLGDLLGAPWGFSGASWDLRGGFRGALGAPGSSGSLLGTSWVLLGASQGRPGVSEGAFGKLWELLGALRGPL